MKGHRILGIIPARGGSKSVPRKNIKIMAGKPLIVWTIEEGHKSQYLDRLILSSEDTEIIAIARQWGCEVPFVRPATLAQDESSSMETVRHALVTLRDKYDYIVLLQPTSPLRTVEDIDACIRLCIQTDAPSCVSVSVVDKSPYWMYTLNEGRKLRPVLPAGHKIERRQDLPLTYILNGAIYVAKTDFLLREKRFLTDETLAYIMPADRSCDIDNEVDFWRCNLIKSQS